VEELGTVPVTEEAVAIVPDTHRMKVPCCCLFAHTSIACANHMHCTDQ
jgi:hypothetical protein